MGLQLKLPAWIPNQEILSVRLAWEAPGSSERQTLIEHLQLPVMPHGELDQLEPDGAVAEQLALLRANRERKRVITELDRGDVGSASVSLGKLFGDLSAMPATPRLIRELNLLSEKLALLKSDPKRSRKNLLRESQRSSLNVWDSDDE